MTELEICLIIIGLICVACSFLFSEHLMSREMKNEMIEGVNVTNVTEEIVKRAVEAEVANVIDDKLEQMEIRVDRITNEKIMAMGEYSEDIQEKISQNHDEVMFLYNMLNDKEDVLKNTIRDIENVKASVKKMAIVNDVAKDVTKKSSVENKAPETKAATASTKKEANKSSGKSNDSKKIGNNNNKMILDLYSKGKSTVEIAKELGLGVGEVRLVVDLFNSR